MRCCEYVDVCSWKAQVRCPLSVHQTSQIPSKQVICRNISKGTPPARFRLMIFVADPFLLNVWRFLSSLQMVQYMRMLLKEFGIASWWLARWSICTSIPAYSSSASIILEISSLKLWFKIFKLIPLAWWKPTLTSNMVGCFFLFNEDWCCWKANSFSFRTFGRGRIPLN